MPTDPFVNPDLDDRPRHRQNLPAGVALPPARSWTGGRPGDVVSQSASRSLRGTPGPNEGFAYALAERAASNLQLGAHEHAEDAIALVAEVAMKRAASFRRAPVVGDVELAIELFGYDGRADSQFTELRCQRVAGAAHDYPRRRALVDSVPLHLLRLSRKEIGDRYGRWRAEFLDAEPG